MRCFKLLFCFLITSSLLAQNKELDSIKQLIENHKNQDTTLVNLRLKFIAKGLFVIPNDSTWPDYAHKTIEIAKAINYEKGVALSYNNLGIVNQYLLSNPYAAIDNYNLAISFFEKSPKLKKYLFSGLGNIGNIYYEQQEFKKAKLNYMKCLEIEPNSAQILTNLANTYSFEQKNDSAIYYFNSAIDVSRRTNDLINLSNALSNLSKVLVDDQQVIAAKKASEEALNIIDEHKLELLRTTAYVNAAMVYLASKDYEQAEFYALNALESKSSLNNLFTEKSILETLSTIYLEQNDYKKAFDAYHKFVVLDDSIKNSDRRLEISRREIQFAADKQKALDDAEIQKQKLIKNSTIIGGSGLALASIIGFVLYRRKRDAVQQKKEAKFNLKVADTELKALRAQMNPHFIFNSLNSINDFISKNDTKSASSYLVKFSKLMRETLEKSSENEILLEDDIQILKTYMDIENRRITNQFTYTFEVDTTIDTENTLIPPMILQPFVENSIIHGFSEHKTNGHIKIGFHKKNEMLICTVEDNGVGREKTLGNKAPKSKKSLGVSITKNRLEIISNKKNVDAYLKIFDKASGTLVEISLPLTLAY